MTWATQPHRPEGQGRGVSGTTVRLLVSGGGTSGHINPALAIIAAVRDRVPEAEVLYVGTEQGMEARLVPAHGIPFATIPARGLVGLGLLKAPGAVLATGLGTRAAMAIIRRFRPHVVVGTGGYVSGPVALAARLTRTPLVISEPDVFPGLTNRLAARWAAAVAVPFPDARHYFPRGAKLVVTGNPVRPSVLSTRPDEARRILGLGEGTRLVYLVGGSRGAKVLNETFVAALPGWLSRPDLEVIYSTGHLYFDRTLEALKAAGVPPELEVGRPPALAGGGRGRLILVPYLDRADAVFAVADVMVTRAGASTLAEITARGVPAVIIPSPNVTHNHQDYNARVLERAGAARVIAESELTADRLTAVVTELLDDPLLRERMHQAALSLARPTAAADLAEVVLRVARGTRA